MSKKKSVAAGMEIAGGKATIALIDSSGCILYRCYAKTLWGRPAAATVEPYLRAIETTLAWAGAEGFRVQGIGVSIPGTLDTTLRRVLLISTLPSLNGFPLCDLLEARYGLPARLHVDVDAALLGEYHFGAGRGKRFRRLLLLAVNAVVGAAFIVNGKPVQPAREYAGYVGHISHMLVSGNGPRCSCGKRGCINTLVSIDAVQKMVQRALRSGEQTSLVQRLLNREYFSPRLVAEEAMQGDRVALQIYGDISRWLGTATSRYISMFEPNAVILGGELLAAGDLVLAQIRDMILAQHSSATHNHVEVVPACLGNDAALLGAVVPLL